MGQVFRFGTLGCSLRCSLDWTSEHGEYSCEVVGLIGWNVGQWVGGTGWEVCCISQGDGCICWGVDQIGRRTSWICAERLSTLRGGRILIGQGVWTDYGFSFNTMPTIYTVCISESWMEIDRGDREDLRVWVQIEQAKSIFELQKWDIHDKFLY